MSWPRNCSAKSTPAPPPPSAAIRATEPAWPSCKPVRCVKSNGPQLVTVHGKDEVVVLSVGEFRRLQGEQTGLDLVNVMQTHRIGM
ncbi:MAG: type II toxin-antitoxin system prevent-host-death family antitoxin [Candidatus Eremiobacteraeota bacterium]|nr:type II toxin-antitoxin system prevent-host-death family antitoxin [Candidatus Eremiobacteraeota bacterium]MCW5868572.1 type II toxin-antitoxin system prevent-host-death family antitoxin [Candidatus Eremiobacteraeota bacterium]